MSKLLLDSNPLVIIPELAVKVGLNESIILQQLHYWLQKSTHNYDGRVWVYNSISDWCEQFPFWSKPTIERTMASLKNKGLILTANYNKMKADRTLWYSIDYKQLEAIGEYKKNTSKSDEQPSHQIDGMVSSICGDGTINLESPIPETTTETTTEIKNQSVSQPISQVKQEDKKTDNGRPTEVIIDESYIKKQIGYDSLIQVHSEQLIQEITLNILDMYYSPTVTIQGVKKPQSIVKSILSKLTYWHINYIIERFNQVTTTIKNKKEYLQTMIYNAVLEMDASTLNEVRSQVT